MTTKLKPFRVDSLILCYQLEIKKKKVTKKIPTTWKLNKMFLNNLWVKEKIKMELRRYFKLNENKDRTYQD